MPASRPRAAALLLLAAIASLFLLAPVSGADAAPQRSGADARQGKDAPPRLAARSWALIDARSGEVLTSHSARRRLPIASTTKMMTAFVALARLDPGRIVRAAPYESTYGESLLELRPGQRVSVRDLLYGLILRSGNDSARDLALAAAGSEKRFVREMNAAADRLGLEDTHYANPIGLDEKGNYSTALDLTTLGRRLLDDPTFARISDTRSVKLRSLRPPRRIDTLNDILYEAPWATGVKTGHTFGAQYVLVGSGRRQGTELISAVVGTWTESERDSESLRLLDYGFSLFQPRRPLRRGEVLARPRIRYTDERLVLRAPRGVEVGVRRGERVRVRVVAPDEVEGPLRRGAALGRALVTVDGKRVASIPLRSPRAVPEVGFFDRVAHVVTDNLAAAAALALAILASLVFFIWRRRRRARRKWAMISREERFEKRRRRRTERERSG